MFLVLYTPVCSPVKSCLAEDHCRRAQENINVVQRESERECERERERESERESRRESERGRESVRASEGESKRVSEWES